MTSHRGHKCWCSSLILTKWFRSCKCNNSCFISAPIRFSNHFELWPFHLVRTSNFRKFLQKRRAFFFNIMITLTSLPYKTTLIYENRGQEIWIGFKINLWPKNLVEKDVIIHDKVILMQFLHEQNSFGSGGAKTELM